MYKHNNDDKVTHSDQFSEIDLLFGSTNVNGTDSSRHLS